MAIKARFHSLSVRLLSAFMLLAFVLAGRPALAQSWTEPVTPELWNERLEIGPVEGLTTIWHQSPKRTGIPLGTTLQMRIRVPRDWPVAWTGAREIDRNARFSTAVMTLGSLGEHTVSVRCDGPSGEQIEESTVLEALNTTSPATVGYEPVAVAALRLSADSVVVDPQNPSTSSLDYLRRSSSVAALRQIDQERYSTSTNRTLVLEAAIQPSGFAPLVEWRLDGVPQQQLGSPARLESYTAGPHILSAGPQGKEKQIELDIYLVHITSQPATGSIVEGLPVTFTAETDPPGYEQDITWVASTRYGSAEPWMGRGPEFHVSFVNTEGPEGQQIGVRADHPALMLHPGDFGDRVADGIPGHIQEARRLCTMIDTAGSSESPSVPLIEPQDLLTGIVLGICGGSGGNPAAVCDSFGCRCNIYSNPDSKSGCGDFLEECASKEIAKYRCSSSGECICGTPM